MGWLANLFQPKTEQRAIGQDHYLDHVLVGRATNAGNYVSTDKASGIPAVHACVQLISETVASLPLHIYRRTDEGRELARFHPLHRVLHERPNGWQTAMEFREYLTASVLLTGNGYAKIVFDGRGAVRELLPLSPAWVDCERLPNRRLRYKYTDAGGKSEVLLQDEVLHVRYRTVNGYTGLSPIEVAREALGIAIAQQATEGAIYRNGARISGVLKAPGKVDDPKTMLEEWNKLYGSSDSAYRTALLQKGLEFQPLQLKMEDLQFIQSRKLNTLDICRIFRVPPPAIGILDDATYSNISEQGLWLVKHTLRPWLVRLEQAMNNALLSEEGRRTHFIEHSAEGLLRGSQKERFEAFAIAKDHGWMSTNEVRRLENLNPIPGGDTYGASANG